MRPDRQRRHTFMAWRRRIAYQESVALRLLCNAHGRMPRVAPTRWDW